jgi:ribosomal protein L37AE/L43A
LAEGVVSRAVGQFGARLATTPKLRRLMTKIEHVIMKKPDPSEIAEATDFNRRFYRILLAP